MIVKNKKGFETRTMLEVVVVLFVIAVVGIAIWLAYKGGFDIFAQINTFFTTGP